MDQCPRLKPTCLETNPPECMYCGVSLPFTKHLLKKSQMTQNMKKKQLILLSSLRELFGGE